MTSDAFLLDSILHTTRSGLLYWRPSSSLSIVSTFPSSTLSSFPKFTLSTKFTLPVSPEHEQA